MESSNNQISPQYRAVNACYDQLITAIRHSVSSVTSGCVTKGLISEDVEDVVTSGTMSKGEQARRIMQCVRDAIKLNPSRYDDFIEILKNDHSLADVLEILQNKYEIISTQAPKRVSFSSGSSSSGLVTRKARSLDEYQVTKKYHKACLHQSASFSYDTTEVTNGCSRKRSPLPDGVSVTNGSSRKRPLSFDGVDDMNDRRRKMLHSDKSLDAELSIEAVLHAIADVTNNWRNIGTQLNIKSYKLDQIDGCPAEEQMTRMVTAWFGSDDNPTWDKLYQALQKQSVNEHRAAEKVSILRRGLSIDSATADKPAQTPNTVSQILVECHDKLVTGLQSVISPVASACYSKHLITENTYRHVLEANTGKAERVLLNVKQSIEEEEGKFQDFVEVLRGVSGCYHLGDYLVNELEKKNNERLQSQGDNVLPFTEATVLDAVVNISSNYDLGQKLGLAQKSLVEIEKYPVEERKQRLVTALFRGKKEFLNWETVNKAIHECEIAQWASAKRTSMTTSASLSFESVSEMSLGSASTGGISMTESMQTSKKIPKKIKGKINVKYSKLKSSIQKKLKEVDEEEFYLYIIDAFTDEGAGDITKLIPETDVNEIFKVLTKHHMLGYSDISQLEGIVDRFLDDDEDLKRSIEEYNLSLDSYMATTKIIEKIRSEDIKEYTDDYDIKKADRSVTANPQKYTVSYRKELQTKLYKHEKEGIELTMESLKYVEKFWNDFCRTFEMPLSSVLDRIMTGCVEITWFIPSGSAQRILERIQIAVGFFQRKFVSNIILENIPIYSESSGIATQKNLDEVKLLLAVQDGSLERVESLLERYLGDVNSPMTKNDTTVLMIAAQTGNTDIVSSLLKHGAEVDQLDADGWSALFYASAQSRIDTVKCLLEHGANITLSTQDGFTVLDVAQSLEMSNALKSKIEHQLIKSAKEGELETVEHILSMGTNVDATDPEKELWTPLMWASWRGHLDTVRCLLRYNPSVNAAAKVGWTALILSSRDGHCEVVEALLDHGANIDQKTDEHWSSLMMAAAKGQTKVGKILLERGAKIDCQDFGGYTPLAQASQDGHSNFVKMLIEHDPDLDLDIKTKGSWTPLMLACKNGREEAANTLITNGADVNLKKTDGVSTLHIACYAGYDAVVKLLLKHKAHVDAADTHGITPLMFAIKQGHFEVFKTLVWSGKADLNLQEKEAKFSAPFFAVQCSRKEMLDILLRNDNIDLGIRDLEGNTILDLAEKQNSDALGLIRERYSEVMEKYKKLPSGAAGPSVASARPQYKLTTKTAQNYIANMLKNIDLRMSQDPGTEISASAA